MNQIAIIGHFGGKKTYNDGQTVKTIAIYDALKRYGVKSIDKVDTYFIRNNPLKFCGQFIKSLILDKQYIVLLSDKGRRILFPVLYVMCKLGKEVYHYGIGGRLAREVENNRKWKKYVAGFKANWMESVELAEQLQKQGITNAVFLPNFKKITILHEEDLKVEYIEPYRLCTFSRVMEEKGIEDAIVAVQAINSEIGRKIVELDIYGPAEERYLQRLNGILEKSDSCRYCGVVPANESVETLKDYYVLLFPTHWRHEGIPGTIIDALSAGIPVISRKWQYCGEMLQHKVTGYLYDFDEPELLKDRILYAISHVSETVGMKKNCLQKAYQYSEDYVMAQVIEQMKISISLNSAV